MKKLSMKFEEVRLVYCNKTKAADRPSIKSHEEAYRILREAWDMEQICLVEECKLLMLDNQLRLMSISSISKGGMTETVVDPRLVFSTALRRRAHKIILAHNHPSGSLKPSPQDLKLTRDLMFLGKTLRIPLEDHLIITSENYCPIVSDGYIDYSF